MSKKAYIGINNSARQVKKIYVGVEDIARIVKKGYVGVNGVAKQFWPSEGLPSKSNTVLKLQSARSHMSTATLGKYGLFGTGITDYSMTTNYVDAFDENFVSHKLTTAHTYKTTAGRKEGFTTVGNYALLGGRDYDSTHTETIKINAYDTSLSRTTPNELSILRSYLAASTVGNYALFGGGRGRNSSEIYSTVDAYDRNLSRTTPTALSQARCELTAATIGNYVLFGSGASNHASSSGTPYNIVDAYDRNLNRTTPTALSEARRRVAAATIGNYILFAGGANTKSGCSIVDAYDKNLNHTTPTELSKARSDLSGVNAGNYALFAGGKSGALSTTKGYTYIIDAYDKTLNRSDIEHLSHMVSGVGTVKIGNHILFGGGYTGSGYIDNIEVYNL